MAPPDHARTRVERASHLPRASFLLQLHACVDGSLRPPRLALPRLALDSTAPSARLGLAQTIRLSVARPYSLALSLVPARYTSLSLARLLFRHFPHTFSLSLLLSHRQDNKGAEGGAARVGELLRHADVRGERRFARRLASSACALLLLRGVSGGRRRATAKRRAGRASSAAQRRGCGVYESGWVESLLAPSGARLVHGLLSLPAAGDR